LVNRLEKLKRTVEKHMEEQVKILQTLTTLNIYEFTEFNKWHKNHHLYEEIPRIIQSLSEKNSEIESK
jgi:hypothetical protein